MNKLQWRASIGFFTSQFRLIPWLSIQQQCTEVMFYWTQLETVYSSSASDVLLDTVVTVIRDVRCCVAMHVQ